MMKNSNAKWRENEKTNRWHKARVPGTLRNSRLPGGNGWRGHQIEEIEKTLRRVRQSERTVSVEITPRTYKPVDTTPFKTCRPNRAERWTSEPMRLKTAY